MLTNTTSRLTDSQGYSATTPLETYYMKPVLTLLTFLIRRFNQLQQKIKNMTNIYRIDRYAEPIRKP